MIGGLVIANMVSNITIHLDHGLRIIYDPRKVTKPRPSGFFVHRYSGDKVRRILLLLRFMWVQRQLAFYELFGNDQGHTNLNNKRPVLCLPSATASKKVHKDFTQKLTLEIFEKNLVQSHALLNDLQCS